MNYSFRYEQSETDGERVFVRVCACLCMVVTLKTVYYLIFNLFLIIMYNHGKHVVRTRKEN